MRAFIVFALFGSMAFAATLSERGGRADLPDGRADLRNLPDGRADLRNLPDGRADLRNLPDGRADLWNLPDGRAKSASAHARVHEF